MCPAHLDMPSVLSIPHEVLTRITLILTDPVLVRIGAGKDHLTPAVEDLEEVIGGTIGLSQRAESVVDPVVVG